MKANLLFAALGLFLLLAGAHSVSAADWIFATVDYGGDCHLITIDTTTGAVTDIGIVTVTGQPGHETGITGLSMHTDGNLYAFDTSGNQIITIDPATATAALVTPVGADLGGWMYGLAIEPNGDYYVTGDQLRKGTLPGPTDPVGDEQARDTDSCDLAPDGTLYATDDYDGLMIIDTATGDQSLVAEWTDSNMAGLAVEGSMAWAIENRDVAPGNQWLVQIDLETGEVSPIFELPHGYYLATALPVLDTVSGTLDCAPSSGTLPFDATFSVSVYNNHPKVRRRMAMRLDVHLANGTWFKNWVAGYRVILGGGVYDYTFMETIPSDVSTTGINRFVLVAEDVTPAPYNQPPFPSSGDLGVADCEVEGIAP